MIFFILFFVFTFGAKPVLCSDEITRQEELSRRLIEDQESFLFFKSLEAYEAKFGEVGKSFFEKLRERFINPLSKFISKIKRPEITDEDRRLFNGIREDSDEWSPDWEKEAYASDLHKAVSLRDWNAFNRLVRQKRYQRLLGAIDKQGPSPLFMPHVTAEMVTHVASLEDGVDFLKGLRGSKDETLAHHAVNEQNDALFAVLVEKLGTEFVCTTKDASGHTCFEQPRPLTWQMLQDNSVDAFCSKQIQAYAPAVQFLILNHYQRESDPSAWSAAAENDERNILANGGRFGIDLSREATPEEAMWMIRGLMRQAKLFAMTVKALEKVPIKAEHIAFHVWREPCEDETIKHPDVGWLTEDNKYVDDDLKEYLDGRVKDTRSYERFQIYDNLTEARDRLLGYFYRNNFCQTTTKQEADLFEEHRTIVTLFSLVAFTKLTSNRYANRIQVINGWYPTFDDAMAESLLNKPAGSLRGITQTLDALYETLKD